MKVLNKANATEILIYEDIGDSFFGGVTVKQVMSALKGAKQEVIIRLNSPGGDVFEGMAIYNVLIQSDKDITTQVDGLAASAASVVFMAAKKRKMAENAFLMIHEAWSMVAGNAAELRERADALEAISGNMAKIYADGTGSDLQTVKDWLADETWFTGGEGDETALSAIDHGFATEIIENLKVAAKFDPAKHHFQHLPAGLQEPPKSRVVNMKIERMKKRALDMAY